MLRIHLRNQKDMQLCWKTEKYSRGQSISVDKTAQSKSSQEAEGDPEQIELLGGCFNDALGVTFEFVLTMRNQKKTTELLTYTAAFQDTEVEELLVSSAISSSKLPKDST